MVQSDHATDRGRATTTGVAVAAAPDERRPAPPRLGSVRLAAVFVILLAVVTVAMRVEYVRTNLVVVDEFEHLHGAYLVARGQTPYVDFFEHHTPLFYYLAAALLPMSASSFDTIVQARYLAVAFTLGTVVLAWRLVRLLEGVTAALVVVCLLLGNFFLFARASVVYLDTFASPFVMLSAVLLLGSRGRRWRCALSGAALGIAVLITQKAVVVAVAPVLFFLGRALSEWRSPERRLVWRRDIVLYALGGLAPALLLPALLGVGALGDFIRDNVTTNLAWRARRFPARELLILGATDGAVYGLAVVGAGIEVGALLKRCLAVEDREVPVLYLVALTLGIFLIPVVWEEYFVLVVPFAVVVAGVTLTRWARRSFLVADGFRPLRGAPGRVGSWPVLALLGVMLVNLIGRKLVPENSLSSAAFLTVMVLWSLILVLIRRTTAKDGYRAAVLWMAFVLVFPLAEQADWIHHNSNAGQRERLNYVLTHTSPDETVFDGYSGYGVFRPHAYRYWFLHEEMQQMLSAKQMGPDIIAALEAGKPPIVIVDQWVGTLPVGVKEYIGSHYVDTGFPEIKRRKDRGVTDRPGTPGL